MDGIVVAIGAFFACGEVIPAVGEANAVAVKQVEVKPQVRIDTREEFAEGFFPTKQSLCELLVDGRIAHVCKVWAVGKTIQRQVQFKIGGQPRVALAFVEGKIVLQQACCAKVSEKGNTRGCILQRRYALYVGETIQSGASPKVQAVAFVIEHTVKELR